MTRRSVVREPFRDAVVKAECRRAMRDGRSVDRLYLRDETGLSGFRLESRISRANRELASAAECNRRTEGGADMSADPSPKGTDPDPFAPPTRQTGKGKQ